MDVEFRRPELDPDGIVVDIGRAGDALRAILGSLNYRNLDEDPAFAGRNTTTEYLAKVVFDRMRSSLATGALGDHAAGIEAIRVTLHESHVASAAYEAELGA